MAHALVDQILSFLALGGPVVSLIVLLSVVALALILIKAAEFLHCRVGRPARAQRAVALWSADRRQEAQQALDQPVSAAEIAVVSALRLAAAGIAKAEIEERVAVEAAADLHRFSKGVRALEAIAQVAPLIGLFGTVLGMIEAFQALQSAGSNVDPSALAGGIWVALMTTAAGLAVAMPVSLVVSWLEGRLESERVAVETLVSSVLLTRRPNPAEGAMDGGRVPSVRLADAY